MYSIKRMDYSHRTLLEIDNFEPSELTRDVQQGVMTFIKMVSGGTHGNLHMQDEAELNWVLPICEINGILKANSKNSKPAWIRHEHNTGMEIADKLITNYHQGEEQYTTKTPKIEFTHGFAMRARDFKTAVDKFKECEYIEIMEVNGDYTFIGKTKDGRGVLHSLPTENSTPVKKSSGTKYQMDFLKPLALAVSRCKTDVSIQYAQSKPLLARVDLSYNASIRFWYAPRVDD